MDVCHGVPTPPHSLISCPDRQGDHTRATLTMISPAMCRLRRSLPLEGGFRKAIRAGQEIVLYVPSRPDACAGCAARREAQL